MDKKQAYYLVAGNVTAHFKIPSQDQKTIRDDVSTFPVQAYVMFPENTPMTLKRVVHIQQSLARAYQSRTPEEMLPFLANIVDVQIMNIVPLGVMTEAEFTEGMEAPETEPDAKKPDLKVVH